jgi:hypothetical protein
LESGMWWLVISTWKQSQPQSKQQEAGSKVDPNRMQSGCEMEAKSIEHARRNGSEINCQTPTTVKHQPILTMEVLQFLIIKHQTPTILEHRTLRLFDFCHCLPLPRKVYIAGHLGLISLSPLMYYFTFTFMQATLIHLHNKTRLALITHHH